MPEYAVRGKAKVKFNISCDFLVKLNSNFLYISLQLRVDLRAYLGLDVEGSLRDIPRTFQEVKLQIFFDNSNTYLTFINIH